jgi:hypothetical protein
MRTISYNIDGADATGSVTAILLSLPVIAATPPRSRHGVKFDRDGDRFTVATRRELSVWLVSFRPVDGDPGRTRLYRSPVDAARAVIDGRHNEQAQPYVDTRDLEQWIAEREQAHG